MKTLEQLAEHYCESLNVVDYKVESYVITPDRLRELFKKAVQLDIEHAFREGYCSQATYNDVELTDINEEWNKYNNANSLSALS